MTDKQTKQTKRAEPQVYGVYMPSMLTMKVQLSVTEVGKNIKQNLEKIISKKTEGKCITDGFIKPNSVKIVNYSSGVINGDLVEFYTLFECMVCHPVEGMLIECQTKTITKAGIHAEVIDTDGTIPVTVFIARDHHFSDKYFATITENAKITVQVIGVRFELNDPYICVIGKLVENRKKDDNGQPKRKPISILGGDADFEYDNHDEE